MILILEVYRNTTDRQTELKSHKKELLSHDHECCHRIAQFASDFTAATLGELKKMISSTAVD